MHQRSQARLVWLSMCGRYASSKDPATLVEEFEVTKPPAHVLEPNYNVAPTNKVYAVLDRQAEIILERLLVEVRWGLVPSWAKDPAIGNKMINARLETAATKPAYRRAWAKRRALLPADGFYEWHTSRIEGEGKPRKQPYFIHPADGSTLAMAGLYELWRNPELDRDDPDAWLWSATVLTTQAVDGLGQIHDRMPIHVAGDKRADWLDPRFAGDPAALLDPVASAAAMTAYPVATLVNSVRNNGPELLVPLPA